MLIPWVLVPMLTTALERVPYYWTLAPSVPSLRKTIIAGLMVVSLTLISAPLQWLLGGQPKPVGLGVSKGTACQLAQELKHPGSMKDDPQAKDWQPKLAKALETYPNKDYHGVIFASETLADHLAYVLPSNTMPVFIDSHVHLFGSDQWQRTMLVKWAKPGWREVLDSWNVNLVVVEAELYPNLRDAVKVDNEWLVLQDETGLASKGDARFRLFVALRKKPKLN